MAAYSIVTVPPGERIRSADGRLDVPDRPILPFIEGDGTGPDIWRASQAVFDAAVQKAYGGKRKIAWMEVYAGEKAFNRFKNWCRTCRLPKEAGAPRTGSTKPHIVLRAPSRALFTSVAMFFRKEAGVPRRELAPRLWSGTAPRT